MTVSYKVFASFSFIFLCLFSALINAEGPACGSECNAPLYTEQKFTPVAEHTDEFRCRRNRCRNLGSKWIRNDPKTGTGGTNWAGRQPLLFVADAIYKRQNHLVVEARGFPKNTTRRWANTFDVTPPGRSETFKEAGYDYYTGGFVQSQTAIKYGFFESRLKPSKLKLVSAFWMSLNTPTKWTEIDVVEACHVSAEEQKFGTDFRRRIKPNAHIFRDSSRGIAPGQGVISANPPSYVHSQDLADGFNDYAVYWGEDRIEWIFNGRPFASIANTYWDQELHPKWTVEANLAWHGVLPDPREIERTRRRERRSGVATGTTQLSIKHIKTWSVEPMGLPTTERQFGRFNGRTNRAKLRKLKQRAKSRLNRKVKEKKERFDVLQRAPYPGETLLKPVTPPPGETWAEEVAKAEERRRRRRR